MRKYNVYAVVMTTKFIGEFEAETMEEAEEMTRKEDHEFFATNV